MTQYHPDDRCLSSQFIFLHVSIFNCSILYGDEELVETIRDVPAFWQQQQQKPSQHDITVSVSDLPILTKSNRVPPETNTLHKTLINNKRNQINNQWTYLNLFTHNEKQLTTMKLAEYPGDGHKRGQTQTDDIFKSEQTHS